MKAVFFILPLFLLLAACDDASEKENAPAPQPAAAASAPEPFMGDEPASGEMPIPSQTSPVAPASTVETPPFTYQDKPIDPACFNASSDGGDEDINLKICTGSVDRQDDSISPAGPMETFGGIYTQAYRCATGCMRQPFVSYQPVGYLDGAHVVKVESSGGGTGVFSTLGFYKLSGDKLTRSKTLAGGDRCNGGVTNASVKDGAVHYSINLTPFDLVEISKGNDAGFKAYEDIAACAACCTAEANYVDDKLVSVTLTQNPKDIVSENLGPKDACFYGTYNETHLSGKTTLDKDALEAFGKTFNSRCAQLKGKDLPASTVPVN